MAPALNWRSEVERLLNAPLDLVEQGARVWRSDVDAVPSAAHRDLYTRYRRDLGVALKDATTWWEMMVMVQEQRVRHRERAEGVVRDLRPSGPCSDPRVVLVLRRYWLACDALNATVATDQQVPCQEFLLEWLVRDGRTDEAKLISLIPYWPVGMDEAGNWT